MDPNANLAEQLALAAELASDFTVSTLDDSEVLEKAMRLAELVDALDHWITGGGFLPARWAEHQGKGTGR